MKKNMDNGVVVNFANIEANGNVTITEEQLRSIATMMGFSVRKNTNKMQETCLIKTLMKYGITYDPKEVFPACKTGFVSKKVFGYLLEKKEEGNSIRVTNTIRVLATAEMHREGRGLKLSIVKTVYDKCKVYWMPEKAISKTANLIQTHTSDATGWVDTYHELINFREAAEQANRFNRKVADTIVEANAVEVIKAQ